MYVCSDFVIIKLSPIQKGFAIDLAFVAMDSWVFPQQHKLMGSAAHNTSGVRWCRSRVRSNEVPEKVPKVPEKVWEASVQRQIRFNRAPEKVLEKVWEILVQSEVRFNRICGHLTPGNTAEVFPALGLAARVRKMCKNKTLRLLGIPPKLFVKYHPSGGVELYHRYIFPPYEITDWLIKWVSSYHRLYNVSICPLPCLWINTGPLLFSLLHNHLVD